MALFPRIIDELGKRGLDDVLVVIGGIIPDVDIPRLKGIGVKYSTAQLQGRIVLPRGSGGYPGRGTELPPYRSVTVVLPSGERYSGVLVAISLFNVTVRDAAGAARSFGRDGDVPRIEIVDPLQAHLDLMRTLTDADMHNLTAFLVTLR